VFERLENDFFLVILWHEVLSVWMVIEKVLRENFFKKVN
jgi:hypothetical protein